MMMRGPHEIASAPTARCFMPPLISCGYERIRASGSAIRTSFSASIALLTSALRPSVRRWICSASTIWFPMVNTGLSEVCGS